MGNLCSRNYNHQSISKASDERNWSFDSAISQASKTPHLSNDRMKAFQLNPASSLRGQSRLPPSYLTPLFGNRLSLTPIPDFPHQPNQSPLHLIILYQPTFRTFQPFPKSCNPFLPSQQPCRNRPSTPQRLNKPPPSHFVTPHPARNAQSPR